MGGDRVNVDTILFPSWIDYLFCIDPCPVRQRGMLAEVQQGLAKDDETNKGQLSSDTHCQVMTTHG